MPEGSMAHAQEPLQDIEHSHCGRAGPHGAYQRHVEMASVLEADSHSIPRACNGFTEPTTR